MMDYNSIILYIWDYYNENKMSALKTLIKKLRQKLPKDTIINIYKEGFVIKTKKNTLFWTVKESVNPPPNL